MIEANKNTDRRQKKIKIKTKMAGDVLDNEGDDIDEQESTHKLAKLNSSLPQEFDVPVLATQKTQSSVGEQLHLDEQINMYRRPSQLVYD